MQCPNCRKVEKGRWLYASGHRPSADIDLGGWAASDNYDITSDLVSAHLRVNIRLGHKSLRVNIHLGHTIIFVIFASLKVVYF